MIRTPPASCLIVAVVACVGGVRLAASDDLVVEEVSAPEPAETVRFVPVDGHGLVVLGGRAVEAEYDLAAVFDKHVFRGAVIPQGTRPMDGTLGRLAGLRRFAERRIATLDRVCGLSQQQRETLELAVESDLRRLAVDIDAARRAHAGQRAKPGDIARERLQRVRADAEACRRRIDEFGRSGTLLGSVSLGLLDARQLAAFTAWVDDRRAGRWEAMVRMVLGQLDDTVLGLSEAQHEVLLARLMADVPPLAVLDDLPAGRGSPRAVDFQQMLVACRLQRLDQADARRRFDPRQWEALHQFAWQGGAAAEIENLLVKQGLLEETR